jgi:diguanylate cyclase (GGDEF)-like protein
MSGGSVLGEITSLLGRAELFSGLLMDDLVWAAGHTAIVSLPEGSTVFSPGDQARSFLVVRSGSVGLSRRDGTEDRLMARYLPGDVFGDLEFAIDHRRAELAVAERDTELLEFPAAGRNMAELARERPDATARILLRSLAMISSRLRATQRLISENSPWVRELRRQIYTDPATGLLSRAFLDAEVPAVLEAPTALFVLKPDRFKDLVDGAGHAAGDEAMSMLADFLQAEASRLGRGWAIRLRSNETALVVPGLGREEAPEIAGRLARGVRALPSFPLPDGGRFGFTASLSLAVWPEDGAEWRRLLDDAQGMLTRAWLDGGDRVYRLRHRGSGGLPPAGEERREAEGGPSRPELPL